MFDIADKKKLIEEISTAIRCAPINSSPYMYINPTDNLNEIIKQVAYQMSKSIATDIATEVVKQIITRLYTHSEFETDLGLRDRT